MITAMMRSQMGTGTEHEMENNLHIGVYRIMNNHQYLCDVPYTIALQGI